MRSFVFAFASVLCLFAPLSALDRWPQRPLSDSAGPIMEARVYFDDVRTLRQLGDLAGRLDIFSPDGRRLVSTGVSGPYTWDCSRVPAGVYFCRLAANRNCVTTRVSVTH